MALIITLILLSVITFMAVTFLVMSRAEKGSVATTTDLAVAREAANAGLERAKSEIMATMLAFTNPGNLDLLVSTNYNNPAGFQSGVRSFTNVSYTRPNGLPITGNDLLANLTNLLYNPRVPVFVTNRQYASSNEFRFYLDLNRNARYDTNGYLPVINPQGRYYDLSGNWINSPVPGATLSNYFVGDPEWIGRLERADLPHSSSNRFIYRYAYLVVPSTKTLDLNYIHNHASAGNDTLAAGGGGRFLRNQGVGTWEINLAGFLADLNTNYWPFPQGNAFGTSYEYSYTPLQLINRGAAFDDALSLIRYRYDGSRANLYSVQQLFGLGGDLCFRTDRLDGYTRGPVLTNTSLPVALLDPDVGVTATPWPGSDNPNHFFTTQELYDDSKTARAMPAGFYTFSDRLRMAGTNTDSYNRYTFYRLLSQLGTDTAWEPVAQKIHLNYDNRIQGITNQITRQVVRSPTNFIPWRPLDFFTNTASRLLANAGYNPTNLNINRIQVYPTNFYSPSIHQLLQLAANIYDATTNNPGLNAAPVPVNPPSVFRPLFASEPGPGGTNIIYITGYQEVVNADQMINPLVRFYDLNQAPANLGPVDMFYGVPLIVGAKKGFPNFNEFAMNTRLQISRKLEFRRPSMNAEVNETNVMYTLSVSNTVGMEAWNSYSKAYPRPLQMRVAVDMFVILTNENNQVLMAITNPPVTRQTLVNISSSNWPGYFNPMYAESSFKLPLPPQGTNDFAFLGTSAYIDATRRFFPLFNQNQPFERHPNGSIFPSPRWWLVLKTRVRYILIDTGLTPNRIVDYVNLDAVDQPLDIAHILAQDGICTTLPNGLEGSMWCTNRLRANDLRSPTYGMINQINASLGNVEVFEWNNVPETMGKEASIDFFRAQFRGLSPKYYPNLPFSRTNVFYSPYVPTRTIYYTTELQVNDPLVHYTLGDLQDLWGNFQTNRIAFYNSFSTNNIGTINRRFEPWGGNPLGASSTSPTAMDIALKDPMLTRSDDWDFPTNKFANIGTLGRVHRGTPWQTINLKSYTTNMVTWQRWSGNGLFYRNVGQMLTNVVPFNVITNDASFTHPINDRYILDLFTTAMNENATRGQMSVNQTNLAAWSALLSGVNIMPNSASNYTITPAGVYSPTSPPPIVRIVAGVQRAMTNYPGRMFRRVGDVLVTPELTVNSPLINSHSPRFRRDLNDAVYERIPQQVLGLLKGAEEPRFTVYTFGQALKPADRSLVTSGPFFGVCTNYQVVAESASRAVLRVEGTPDYPRTLTLQPPLDNLRVVVESFNMLPPD